MQPGCSAVKVLTRLLRCPAGYVGDIEEPIIAHRSTARATWLLGDLSDRPRESAHGRGHFPAAERGEAQQRQADNGPEASGLVDGQATTGGEALQ